MTKILTVATEVQKKVFEEVLLEHIQGGFWKNARPSDHADLWIGVCVTTGSNLGPNFDTPRKYNFVNPYFFKKEEDRLMSVAREVDPEITPKKLKKQLIALNRIIDGRLKEIGGDIQKLSRGRKQPSHEDVPSREGVPAKSQSKTQVRKVVANIVDPATVAEDEAETA